MDATSLMNSLICKCRPIQVVYFSLCEFWQIVCSKELALSLGYQICGYRVVHSISLFLLYAVVLPVLFLILASCSFFHLSFFSLPRAY